MPSRLRVDLPTPDGLMDVYVVRPDGEGPWPAVVLFMDAFGIRDALLGMAARLAAAGYVVAVPNLYYRSGEFPPFDPVQVAAGGAERDRFKGMIASITNTLIMRDTTVLLGYLDADASVRRGAMGVVGYCMGGGYALRAAGTFPDRIAAAAIFHAGSLATDKPDSAHLLADQIRARVYVGVAGLDPSFDQAQRGLLETALTTTGVDYALEVYEGAKHGFAVSGHLVYDERASERHWASLLRLYEDSL
jgi:carboxymethylenebutenolidase